MHASEAIVKEFYGRNFDPNAGPDKRLMSLIRDRYRPLEEAAIAVAGKKMCYAKQGFWSIPTAQLQSLADAGDLIRCESAPDIQQTTDKAADAMIDIVNKWRDAVNKKTGEA